MWTVVPSWLVHFGVYLVGGGCCPLKNGRSRSMFVMFGIGNQYHRSSSGLGSLSSYTTTTTTIHPAIHPSIARSHQVTYATRADFFTNELANRTYQAFIIVHSNKNKTERRPSRRPDPTRPDQTKSSNPPTVLRDSYRFY